mmetsp:Transcript_48035/g.104480  ORF Transcript_48035/g.104480 Transcript_48035/m.104480 type:complete len:271 (+) Transcript_48035:607-1419(+)
MISEDSDPLSGRIFLRTNPSSMTISCNAGSNPRRRSAHRASSRLTSMKPSSREIFGEPLPPPLPCGATWCMAGRGTNEAICIGGGGRPRGRDLDRSRRCGTGTPPDIRIRFSRAIISVEAVPLLASMFRKRKPESRTACTDAGSIVRKIPAQRSSKPLIRMNSSQRNRTDAADGYWLFSDSDIALSLRKRAMANAEGLPLLASTLSKMNGPWSITQFTSTGLSWRRLLAHFSSKPLSSMKSSTRSGEPQNSRGANGPAPKPSSEPFVSAT